MNGKNIGTGSRRRALELSKRRVLQSASCFISLVLVQAIALELRGTEFSGGRLTARLLHLSDSGSLLLLCALLLTFIYPRVAAGLGMLATLLSVPLYFYLIAPGPFRRIVPGNYSVPLVENFAWDKWPVFGLLMLVVFASTCIWNLSMREGGSGN
jgi:hypothetical protein